MNLQFFEGLSEADAKLYLERFLVTGREALGWLTREASRRGIDADLSVASITPVFGWLTGLAGAVRLSLACIPLEPGRGSANIVDITVNRARKREMNLLAGFFEGDFFARHDVAYACLDTWPEYLRQHVAGTINDRLPGVFWLNWLSGRYVEAIGEDAVLSLPWFKTVRLSSGLTCWLYKDLGDVPDDRAERVVQFETALGREKFVKNGWQNLPQLAVSAE